MDRGFCSGSNLKHMLDRNYRFVLLAPITGKVVKRLLTSFNSSKESLDMKHDGHMYKVWNTELGIVADGNRKRANDE